MGVFYLLIIDGLGVGAQEDARLYGDLGTNTLGHVCAASRCELPFFSQMGLGNIIPLDTVEPILTPTSAWGKMRELSAGKDSTTGHWELAGVSLAAPFPTYPDGFPDEIVKLFCTKTGNSGVLANKAFSGTEVIDLFGEEHLKTGLPILYTSADSVFQLATHINVVDVQTLYQWCEIARTQVMVGPHSVGRVIARPFTGNPGSFSRLSELRHDFSLEPPDPNLPVYLQQLGIKTYSVGKVIDLFAEKGFDYYRRTKSNSEGISTIIDLMDEVDEGFVFINLIDTDQLYGHRNDPLGFGSALEEIDRALPVILSKLGDEDVLIITGDHGNDPTTPGTDHTREFVPLLVYPSDRAVAIELGTRESFRDVAASVCSFFKIPSVFDGESFLK